LRSAAPLDLGIDHEHYRHQVSPVPQAVQRSLTADLQGTA
jgi:hypothetical protein